MPSTSTRTRPVAAGGDRPEGGAQAVVGEGRRVDAVGQVAQLGRGRRGVLLHRAEERPGGGGIPVEQDPRRGDVEGQAEQALLGAVVQVALDAASLAVDGGGEPGPAGLRVGEGAPQPRVVVLADEPDHADEERREDQHDGEGQPARDVVADVGQARAPGQGQDEQRRGGGAADEGEQAPGADVGDGDDDRHEGRDEDHRLDERRDHDGGQEGQPVRGRDDADDAQVVAASQRTLRVRERRAGAGHAPRLDEDEAVAAEGDERHDERDDPGRAGVLVEAQQRSEHGALGGERPVGRSGGHDARSNCTSRSTTAGSSVEPPAATLWIASWSWAGRRTVSFSR